MILSQILIIGVGNDSMNSIQRLEMKAISILFEIFGYIHITHNGLAKII